MKKEIRRKVEKKLKFIQRKNCNNNFRSTVELRRCSGPRFYSTLRTCSIWHRKKYGDPEAIRSWLTATATAVMPTNQPLQHLTRPTVEERHPILEEHGYRIIKMLGKGSFALVRLAYSEHHQTNVAVKIISKRDAPAKYLQKFLPREINIIKKLRHPHVVVCLQAGRLALSRRIIVIIIILLIRICKRQGSR